MKRPEILLGLCIALLAVCGEANERKNQRNFFDVWDTAPAAVTSEDFTLEGQEEGSGSLKENTHTHGDDEDYYEVAGSGDGITNQNINLVDEEESDGDIEIQGESDDEDLSDGSGSGDSEEIFVPPIVPDRVDPTFHMKTTPATGSPLTPCQSLRKAAMEVAKHATSIPECDENGNYTKMQCVKDRSMCWCVDENGGEIHGTNKTAPEKPDCDFGENMSTCVFQLVQHSMKAINAYKPKCTLDGFYEPIQCQETRGPMECWCVDQSGNEILGSVTKEPKMPKCEEFDKKPEPESPTKTIGVVIPDTKGGYNVDSGEQPEKTIDVHLEPIDIDDEDTDSKMNEMEDGTNSMNDKELQHGTAAHAKESNLFSQPGLLAAIIGATVVGLLCIVLLVMFLVYRMRKKDEGSYPLEEQKYPNYQYTKAPEKEFYA